ncbi:MAG: response regulator [Methylococcales bacterium]
MTTMKGIMSNKRILLVEDDFIFSEIIQDVLTEAGFIVQYAEDGLAAWKLIEAGDTDFAAILVDRLMPRMDGVELLVKIKAIPELVHLPIIMVTSSSESTSIQEGLDAGAYYYLIKPFEPKVLLSIVKAAIEQYHDYLTMQESLQLTQLPFNFLVNGTFQFQSLDEASLLANSFAHACPQPENVILGLSELFINAVEHGNLGISYEEKGALINNEALNLEIARRQALEENRDKRVVVCFERQTDALVFTIKDQGKGFDWWRYLDFDPERVFDPNGRGIAMARIMSFDSLEYQGNGNIVVATVRLENNSMTP